MGSELSLEQIKELMRALGESGLTRMQLKIGEMELALAREQDKPKKPHRPKPPVEHTVPESEPEVVLSPPREEGSYIVSPMVGAFYGAPSPDADPFVKVGDEVDEDTVVCIIEAMKVMNEVKAGVKGKIGALLVDNGAPVEFGTKLFEIE